VLVVELIEVILHVLIAAYQLEVVVYGKAMDYHDYFFRRLSLREMELDEQYQIIFLQELKQ
jgi:hypothetical protein